MFVTKCTYTKQQNKHIFYSYLCKKKLFLHFLFLHILRIGIKRKLTGTGVRFLSASVMKHQVRRS